MTDATLTAPVEGARSGAAYGSDGGEAPVAAWRYIMLYTLQLTVDLDDDTEARELMPAWVEAVSVLAEVIENRWYRDTDAEARAALVGVEWGGR